MSQKKSPKKFSSIPPASASKKSAEPVVKASTPVELPKTAAAAPASVATVVAPVSSPQISKAPSAAATALIAALQDASADTAREAAISLGKLGEASAVAPLIEVIADNTGYYHSVVRAAACASLGQLRDRSATPALLNAVHDSMAEASAEAVRALATLGDERAITPLTDVLRNEQGFFLPVVRLAAVNALRTFKGPQVEAALRDLAANAGEDPVIRAATH